MLKTNKGITLLALIITIVIMLILVSVTVTVAINGGLFEYAGKSKYKTELSREKEIIQNASILAEGASKTGRITVEEMQKAINKVADTNNVIDNTDTIAIKFSDSNRYYTVDNKGKLEGPIEMTQVDNAGNMGTDQTYANTTEFVINCIEDLVAFSIMTNGGNEDLGLASGDFSNKNVKLARDLDFNSIFSYNDYSTKIYGDLNGDGTEDDIKTELTKQGNTCGGFTPIGTFKGTFDGQGNSICNLYENRGDDHAGLFKEVISGTIQNLGLENITLIGSCNIGGITAKLRCGTIENCNVDGVSNIKLVEGDYIGLIVGIAQNYPTYIKNCSSKGELLLDATSGHFGGIIGCSNNYPEIYRCYNIMKMKTNISTGGIVGVVFGMDIEECFHIGEINGGNYVAGICGKNGWGSGEMRNCYNIGNINGTELGAGIIGGHGGDIYNCYSIGKTRGEIMIDYNYSKSVTLNCFARRGDKDNYANDVVLTEDQILKIMGGTNGYKCEVLFDNELKADTMITKLNNLVEKNEEGNIIENTQTVWKKDTAGINKGYPIFTWQTVGANSQ